MNPIPQIVILDAGGQYCHLIARKVRDLGVYAEVRPAKLPPPNWRSRKGIIISGGPRSVYDPDSPTVDPAIFRVGQPVLGICYGQQLMAHLLGGEVRKGDKGEYGLATLELDDAPIRCSPDSAAPQQIWMSHRDRWARVPAGFSVVGRTSTCAVAAIAAPARKLYGVQFHPEVVHTTRGQRVSSRTSSFASAAALQDWDPRHRVPLIEQEIREARRRPQRLLLRQRRRGFHVAFTLCMRALGTGARARRLRRYRADARGRDRFRAAHAGHRACEHARGAVPERAGRGDRPGTEAPHHRRGVRARAGAHYRIAAPARRTLDPGPGHHLSRHDRIRRHGQGGAHQDAPQPRGGHPEADRMRAGSWSR